MTKEQMQAKEIEVKETAQQVTEAPAKEAKAEVVAPKVEAKKDTVTNTLKAEADKVVKNAVTEAKKPAAKKPAKAKTPAKPVEKMVKKPAIPAPKADEKVEKPAETAPKAEAKPSADDKKAKALTKAKSSVKADTKKPTAKKEEVTKAYTPWFPESFKQGDTTFVKLNKAYSYEEIVKLLEEDTDLYLACHWTKQDIKQFAYAKVHGCKNPEGGVFPLDLDVCQVSHIAYLRELIDAWSVYTDAEFYFAKADKAFDKNVWEHDGREEVCRVENDLPFEVYTIAE